MKDESIKYIKEHIQEMMEAFISQSHRISVCLEDAHKMVILHRVNQDLPLLRTKKVLDQIAAYIGKLKINRNMIDSLRNYESIYLRNVDISDLFDTVTLSLYLTAVSCIPEFERRIKEMMDEIDGKIMKSSVSSSEKETNSVTFMNHDDLVEMIQGIMHDVGILEETIKGFAIKILIGRVNDSTINITVEEIRKLTDKIRSSIKQFDIEKEKGNEILLRTQIAVMAEMNLPLDFDIMKLTTDMCEHAESIAEIAEHWL